MNKLINILLAEIDPKLANYIIDSLSIFSNINIDVVNSSFEAIKFIKNNPNKYNILITDINMPIKDGIEIIQYIKSNNYDIFTITMTALNDSNTLMKLLEVGLDKFLPKPINIENLQTIIKEYIYKKENSEQTEILNFLNKTNTILGQNIGALYVVQNGYMAYVNQTYANLLGYKNPEEIINKIPVFDLVAPISKNEAKKNVMQRLNGEIKEVQYEVTLVKKDGSYIIVEANGISTFYNNKPAVMGILVDKTTIIKTQTALSTSENNLQLFIKHSPAAIAMFDTKMNYIMASYGWYKEYNLIDTDIVGKNHYDIFTEMPDSWKEAHKRGLKGKISKEENDIFVRNDGSKQYIRWEIHPWYEENQKIGGILIYTSDVTLYHKLEEEILKQKKELLIKNKELENSIQLTQNIIDNAPVRIFWKDINGLYLGANKLFLKDAQIQTKEQIIGKTDYDMVWSDIAHLYREDDKKVLDSKKAKLQYEEIQTQEDGTTNYLITSKIPLFDENNNIYGILGVYDDITEQKKKDLLLVEQLKMAAMGEMIGNIAHQWRQPLSVISTASTGMKLKKENGELSDEDFYESCRYINKNVQYLSQTIDTFRDFIKGGNEKQKTDICDLLDESISLIEASFKNNHIELINNVYCDVKSENKVNLSKNEFSQVIINILNNSKDVFKERNIKNPWVKLAHIDKENYVIITIEDNGGGIKEEVLPHIFEPYFTTKNKLNGTGLGLHMAYKIITESIGGKIHAENSTYGVKFYIEIPIFY